MPPLAEFQSHLRHAMVHGDTNSLAPFLVGSRHPEKRFAIYARHYEASLVRALMEKYPAVNWLVGSPLLIEAARSFVRRHPPSVPCIAEYGADFPAFLSNWPDAALHPWIRFVGELEWHVGHAVLAIEQAPLARGALAAMNPDQLPELVFRPQPGLRYLSAPWPVDDLVKLFLSEAAPERFDLDALNVYLEIHGSRGAFSISRLEPGVFAFRELIAAGQSIGAAAERANETDQSFDPGSALASLIADGLAVEFVLPLESATL